MTPYIAIAYLWAVGAYAVFMLSLEPGETRRYRLMTAPVFILWPASVPAAFIVWFFLACRRFARKRRKGRA